MNLIDISTDLLSAEVYPGDPEPRLQQVNRMDCGDDFNLTALYASLHTGTHVDAASHVMDEEDAETITDYSLDHFIGPCYVVELPAGPITGQVVEENFPRFADRVLIKSDGPVWFFGGAAEDLSGYEYKLLGFEGLSIGGDDEIGVHRTFLGRGTVLLEGLDLSKLTHGGEYFLMAPPVKIDGREASFARAVLVEDSIVWRSHTW